MWIKFDCNSKIYNIEYPEICIKIKYLNSDNTIIINGKSNKIIIIINDVLGQAGII